jgi:isochorismate hydrolase
MAPRTEQNTPLSEAVALLVLDIQNAFLPVIHESKTFLSRSAFAIEAARVFRIRTIFTEQVPDKLGHSHPHLLRLAEKPKVFHKTAFSALQADDLGEYLKKHGIYHLLIIGLEVPVCVYQTVLQAIDHEIDVTLLSDCLGSRRPQDNPVVLSSLAQMGCNILPSETVFYSLLGDATNPILKPYTGLVKKYATDIEIKNDEPASSPPPQKKDLKKPEKPKAKKEKRSSQKAHEKPPQPIVTKSKEPVPKNKKTKSPASSQDKRLKQQNTSKKSERKTEQTNKTRTGNKTGKGHLKRSPKHTSNKGKTTQKTGK